MDYVRRFYTEYQQLLELQLTVFENALQSALEMIYRLDDDFPKLLKRFADGAEDIRIRDISQGLGDSHRGGRTVALITFSNGLRVVYKPRNIGAEKGFRYYSIAMNEGLCLGEKALYETKLLDCGEYGYMEFIQQEECKDAGGVERYFYRSGILMAMLYSLNAKDIHHENLIAHGEYPVMIDLEALFHSNLEHADIESEKSAYEIAMDSINDSVYSIGLLPSQLTNPFNKEEASVDISGFGGGDTEQVSPFKVLKIQNRNTDEICLKKSAYMIEPQKNVVKYEGEAVKSSDYTDFIMKGFEDAYKFIESHKSELAISFDLWFDSVCTRVIYRPTYLYTKLMFTGGHPDFMREKAHRYVLMHRMAYKIKKQEADIVKSEIRDMMTEEAYRETDNLSYYKTCALTFDDGPSGTNTPKVLNSLMETGATATFFVIGNRIEGFEYLVQREHDGGHAVASHNWHHGNVLKSSVSALRAMPKKVNDAMIKAIGIPVRYDRVPGGRYPRMISAGVGWAYIQWSLDTYDWRGRSTSQVMNKVQKAIQDGDIILCHDIKDNTPESTRQMVRYLEEQGYMLLTVDELFAKDGVTLEPDTVYFRCVNGETGIRED